MEVSERCEDRSKQTLDIFRQAVALFITSYPVFLPLLQQLNEDLAEGLDQVAESLPKVAEALGQIRIDATVTEDLAKQFLDVMPELEMFFRKMQS